MLAPNTKITPLNVNDWIAHYARASSDQVAQVDLASNRSYTYAQMHNRVGKLAGAMLAKGIKKDDRVGFLALNSTDVFEVIFASWRIGAIPLALNFRLTAPELTFIISDASPSAIFFDTTFQSVVDETIKNTNVKHWVSMNVSDSKAEYETLLESGQKVEAMVDLSHDDLAALMYSSGTTGLPKGVMITHGMLYHSTQIIANTYNVNRSSTNLAAMPLFHIGGLNIFGLPVFHCGGKNIIMKAFDPSTMLKVISDPEHHVTHFLGVPAMFNAMSQVPEFHTSDYSRLVSLMAGAEAVPNALVRTWYERGVVIQEGYGMTESCATNCGQQREDVPELVGSCGQAVLHSQMKVIKADGSEAKPNELGEIWMKGPVITPGYWNRPEANKENFIDGWFKSGDIAKVDEKGYFYIEDRVKDMYISGGENVYPAEVENVLYQMEEINEVAVIGVADKKWGETGLAVIALKEGQTLSLDQVQYMCFDKLAKFKIPRHIAFVDALPRNATGKVLKFQLRKKADTLVEQSK